MRVAPLELDRGQGVTEHGPRGPRAYRWCPVEGDQASLFPPSLLPSTAPLLAPGPRVASPEALSGLAGRLWAQVQQDGARGLDLVIQDSFQQILCASEARTVADLRRHLVLELRVSVDRPEGPADLWRPLAFTDLAQLESRWEELAVLARGMTTTLREAPPPRVAPRGEQVVVFPPGAASGSFFHEVCGHPMEGDVLGRGASYLSALVGQRVAEPFVTVSDDPTCAPRTIAFGVDDEGTPSARVPLIDQGRVGQPLLDLRSAGEGARPPNGHGRRVSYRHFALPRMSHTQLEPHQGSLEGILQETGSGVLVQHLTPRHMDLLRGTFSFVVNEAREIRDGRLGGFLGPAVLRGDGLSALAAIDRVGADHQNLLATRGCRKLDHGPLPVSFGQPAVRFSRLWLEPWSPA